MPSFDGHLIEPQVGEIRVLRSFAIADDGSLLPITPAGGRDPWCDGENVASCTRKESHQAPDEDCFCGFYAYGLKHWVDRDTYGWFHHVMAVVECYGKVVAGEKGVRAGRARIVGIWLSGKVPQPLADRIAAAYPSTQVFRDRKVMLETYPLSTLDTYSDGPGPVSRAMAKALNFSPALGLLAGVLAWGERGVSVAPTLLFGVLLPVVWLYYFMIKKGLSSASRALRSYQWTVVLLVFSIGVGVLFHDPKVGVLCLCVALLSAMLMYSKGKRVAVTGRDFRAVVRSAPLSRLTAQGISRLKPDGEAFIQSGRWVQMLHGPQGQRVAFAQTLAEDEAENSLSALSRWAKDEKVVGLVISISDRWVYVADRAGREDYTLGAAMPIDVVFEALGMPDGIWCPYLLRTMHIADALDAKNGVDRFRTVDRVTRTVSPKTAIHLAQIATSDPASTLALHHARALAGRRWYRDIQTAIAQAGVTPALYPGIPESVPEVSADDLTSGWHSLFLMTGTAASIVANLYEAIHDDLPHTARLEPMGTAANGSMTGLLDEMMSAGWVRVTEHPTAAHLSVARLEADEVPAGGYMIHGDHIALIYRYPDKGGVVASIWSVPAGWD